MTLPELAELKGSLRVVVLPMRQRFRGVSEREVALIRGPHGWGEFSPFIEYGVMESSRWLAAAIEAAYQGWPEGRRASIEINATIPSGTPQQALELLSRFDGCTTVKLKVAEAGENFKDDLDRVIAVERFLGGSGKIRLDANGAWSVDEAERNIGAFVELLGTSLDYVEQPCRTIKEIAQLHSKGAFPVRIAIDEGIRKEGFTRDLAEVGDVAILKVAPLGGVRSALKFGHQIDLPIVVSSALESSIGIRAGLALAAALPRLYGACGLGTVDLFAADVVDGSLVAHGGRIALCDIVPTQELLNRHSAPAERYLWWQDRLESCYRELEIA